MTFYLIPHASILNTILYPLSQFGLWQLDEHRPTDFISYLRCVNIRSVVPFDIHNFVSDLDRYFYFIYLDVIM